MPGTEIKGGQVVQLRLGETVVVKAVPFPVPENAGQREDQKPAFEELDRFIRGHWRQIRNLSGGGFEDDADLATEKDTLALVGILKDFGVTPEAVRDVTKKILASNGLSTRDASLHAQALSEFLEGFEE